ncbi:ABC transporter permease [Pullulanibacillus camelliae]|uniref:ABC transporter permease n=1 Tax=Pullulanibacillus camelliae TaxID=1707096 RepID=A0A8J2YBX3_9BACL|nr:ABC transporter permease [Pullulanibacillus camelliae]GGE34937.1 ABC transporter permease [Pullulanibacillus camelliae]
MTFRQFAIYNVVRNKRTYAAYFLSSAFSVLVFFVYALFIFHPGVNEGVTKQIAVEGMKVAEYIIYVFSFLFILYSVSAFLKTRHREFGILMMHGMSRRQLNSLVFLENMLIGFSSMVVGIGFGIVFAKVFLMLGAHIMNFVDLPFYLSWKPLILTLVAFFVLFLVISTMTPLFIRSSKLIDLLKGTTKPRKEPKASVIVSLLTAAALVMAYYLSVTTTTNNIGQRLLMVVPLTIVTTYFLFSQLSIFVTRLLKRKQNFYLRSTNMITLSDLAYKMKDNARMFFLVSIVSTVAFCAIGSFAAMKSMDKQFAKEFPFAINYVSKPGDQAFHQHVQTIEQDLTAKHLSYKKVSLTTKVQDSGKTKIPVTLISVRDYNRFAQVLGFSPLEVKDDEAYVVPTSIDGAKELKKHPIRSTTLEPSGKALKIAGVANLVLYKYFDSNSLVVSDAVFNQLQSHVNKDNPYPTTPVTYVGYKVEDWKATDGIGAKLSKNIRAQFKKDPETSLPYKYTAAGEEYKLSEQMYSIMFFIALLIGAVFFIAAGSFLYFRLYADLERDQRHYHAITKIGLTNKELNKTVTIQLSLLFFVPILVAVIHSAFAFVALQSLFAVSIFSATLWVLLFFIAVQIIYFFLIRFLYLKHLKAGIV